MTHSISNAIAKWLSRHGAIKTDELALYSYAVFNILHTFIPFIIVVFIGFLCDLTLECIMMLLPFLLLRKYCGGFHAKTPFKCLILTVIIQILFMLIGYSFASPCVFMLLLFTSATTICILSPVNPEKRKLNENDIKRCKKRAVQLTCSLTIICLLLLMLRYEYYSFFIGTGMIMVAFTQYPCILAKARKAK